MQSGKLFVKFFFNIFHEKLIIGLLSHTYVERTIKRAIRTGLYIWLEYVYTCTIVLLSIKIFLILFLISKALCIIDINILIICITRYIYVILCNKLSDTSIKLF